ncbi:TPA: excisionase [Enterobacter asburiae]|nr:excisionase [Enterobacter asburiae]
MGLITLKEWNARQPRPRCLEQVRRWVREGKIYPAPILDGREYLFDERARKITSHSTSAANSLLNRVNNGKKQKLSTPRPSTKSVR